MYLEDLKAKCDKYCSDILSRDGMMNALQQDFQRKSQLLDEAQDQNEEFRKDAAIFERFLNFQLY
jgi:hypothetical protein